MKIAAIIWNILLLGIALYGGFVLWGPMVYEQAHYQFADPRGDNSMWPATFAMILFLFSFFACLLALSLLFNRNLGPVARTVAGILAALLLGGWFMTGFLWSRHEIPGGFHTSVPVEMFNFDGVFFLLVALSSFSVAAALGQGSITLSMKVLRRITKKRTAG